MSLVECVPNFSEGRRPELLRELARVMEAAGARVLDAGADPEHNRAVVTLAGEPAAVAAAAFEAIALAAREIDLRRHAGVHPRMGATDVCPLVPLEGSSTAECVALARALGERVGGELGIPVFFYGDAARRPERAALPVVRRGGFEALREAIGRDPAREPDAGPRAIHPSAGATAIGVRPFLIAFNVNLETPEVGVARAIAGRVRERDGGLPGIRALGFSVQGGSLAQVSTNVCDFRRTDLCTLFDAIERLARERGVAVRESELVGLAPRAALDAAIARHVRLRGFDPARQVLEERLR